MTFVLMVNDTRPAVSLLEHSLRHRGLVVRTATSTRGLARELMMWTPDILVVDLTTGRSGCSTDLVAELRAIALPLLVVGSRPRIAAAIRSLDGRPDVHQVVSPVSGRTLSDRIGEVVSRTAKPAVVPSILAASDLTIDFEVRRAFLHGNPLPLTRPEFELLAYLVQRKGTAVANVELNRSVLAKCDPQSDSMRASRRLQYHVSALRRKLGETAAHPRYLHTLRGIGLKLVLPAR